MKGLILFLATVTVFQAKADYIACEYNRPASQMFLDMGNFFIYRKHPGQPTGPLLSPENHCLSGDKGTVQRTGFNPIDSFRVDYVMTFLMAPDDAWTSYGLFTRDGSRARLTCWGPRVSQVDIPFTNCKSMKGPVPE